MTRKPKPRLKVAIHAPPMPLLAGIDLSSKPKPKPRLVKRRMWGGFVDDALHWERDDHSKQMSAAIFFKRAVAREVYQDVRPVTVSWTKPAIRKRR